MIEYECCGTCKYSRRAKGYGLGEYDYWCDIQHGQKYENYCCDLYEREL